MYPDTARTSSRIEVDVDPTGEGIGMENTLDDVDSDPTEEEGEDSVEDELAQILALEMRDFDDEEGIVADVETSDDQ
jgi:hypothetical protein